jgi:hypothetical protein
MDQVGATGERVDSLAKKVKEIAKQLQQGTGAETDGSRPRVQDVLPDAPVPDETVVPSSFRLTKNGIVSFHEGLAGDIKAPIVIVGRGKETTKRTECLELAWFWNGTWHRRTVEREVVASAQKITTLAAFGLPVTSNNARLMVQYIADFEAANIQHLPMADVSHKLGYQSQDGDLVFLLGDKIITADGIHDAGELDQLDPEQSSTRLVHFQGCDDGDDQIAAGFHASGTFEKWRESIAKIAAYPKVLFAIYAALTAPMLNILGTANFNIDFAGETTGGKTVTLRAAASCFGNPDEQGSKPAAIKTWNATRVWIERAPAVANDLPFILDETKLARCPQDVAEVLYLVSQGRGRGRGSTKGTAIQETFNTVMLSSGEQPATSFTEDGGTKGRVIQFWGSPFGGKNLATGRVVRALNNAVLRHHGHVGRRFIRFILKNRKQWPGWRKRYLEFVEAWEARAGDNALAGRLAASFAAISITAELVHEAMILPWEFHDPVEPLWDEIVREASDQAAAALQYVVEWANAHENEFYGRDESKARFSGWAGQWVASRANAIGKTKRSSIAFLPYRLNQILQEGKYEPKSIIRTWKDRGWLECEKGHNTQHVRMPKENIRMIVVRGKAIEKAETTV